MDESGKHICPVADPVLIFTRSPDPAVFNREIKAAQPETVAGGIDVAVIHTEIPVVASGNGIIPGAEIASGNRKIPAKPGMKTIMPSPD
jgi:hypothetical protein